MNTLRAGLPLLLVLPDLRKRQPDPVLSETLWTGLPLLLVLTDLRKRQPEQVLLLVRCCIRRTEETSR